MRPLPLGTVVHDTDGHPWVYFGWRESTVGTTSHFFRMTVPGPRGRYVDWQYHAVFRGTLIKKFPDLADHWPG